eukprot:CAMPEP_0177612538 /NCGR_PEP_ID=MMETSP0419_2-20121207/21290_1 /TAXON_ID=582737 /ORGANISM="Tetraselmis sp., Strain GSL018" /LENGTH=261 /DNA_ID=CAMNT_0019108765 /DNA_START=149 /DNA_END=933 /DNA_ORIENTATION=+
MSSLKQAMYTSLPKPETLDSASGLQTPPTNSDVQGALGGAAATDPSQREVVVLVPTAQMGDLLSNLSAAGDWRGLRVRGVLVLNHTAGSEGRPESLSDEGKFPSAALAPYDAKSYAWNPSGSGIRLKRFDFPVFLLDGETSRDALRRADLNERQGFSGALHVADLDATMDASRPSLDCIGHSVYAAVPPLPTKDTGVLPNAQLQRRDVVLVTAQMDTDAFFKDLAQGADSPISGLIAMLAAAEALSAAPTEAFRKHVVFLA